jgi:hypothetical protein
MILPFPEYAPDVTPFGEEESQLIQNVFPRKDGYGPVNGINAYSQALGAACRGYFYARNGDGSITVFAATAADLWQMNNSTLAWSKVTKTSLQPGGYTAVANGDQWQFAQFNNYVIAVQGNANPQYFDLTSSTNFDDISNNAAAIGIAPQARYVAVVNRFLVLSGLGASTPYRVFWSGLNAPFTFQSGTNSSDYQDLPDGGIVRAIGGGEFGLIMQDQAIRRMIYAFGSDYIFQIERVSQDVGMFAPLSLVRAGDRLFFLAHDGFYVIDAPGTAGSGYPRPIGKERVNRTFFADVDASNLQLIIGVSDPKASRVYWTYKSINGASGQFDKVLCYDWAIDRWSIIIESGEYMSTLARPGITLESLDAIAPGGSIDAMTTSLDNFATVATAQLSIVDGTHTLGFFTGANLEAQLDSAEQELADGRRIRIRGFRPLTDATTVVGAVGTRENLQTAVSYSAEQAVDSRGRCVANVSTRIARGHIRIPAGSTWTFAAGVEPFFSQEGLK